MASEAAERALSLPWDAGFAALGLLAPHRPPPWASPGGLRILVVAPHPDDEVAGCGGTILLHRERGDAVTVLHVTDGRRSRALGLAPHAMALRRRDEARRAADILDAEAVWLGLPEGGWARGDLAASLAEALAEGPDVVYAPSRVDFHPEHREVAAALGAALAGVGTAPAAGAQCPPAPAPLIRVYQVQVPLTAVLANRVASTAPVAARLREAMAAYGSQRHSLRRTLRMRRYAGLRWRTGGEAEPFWELSAEAYAAVHPPGGSADPTRSPFRGLRALPLSDPLCYLSGRGERRRLL